MPYKAKLRTYFIVYIVHDCDTCDSKKTTSLLERAHAHTYARKRLGISPDFERKNIFYIHHAPELTFTNPLIYRGANKRGNNKKVRAISTQAEKVEESGRKGKMTGSSLFHYQQHLYGIITGWGLFDECGIEHHNADVVAKLHSPTSCSTLRIAHTENGLTAVRQLTTKTTTFIVG